MKQVALELGCPEDQIWLETESLTTFENAKFGKAVLESKGVNRIILVTQAFHMNRAMNIFQRQQLEVIPAGCDYPCDYWSTSPFMRLVPTTSHLLASTHVIEDACSYLIYSLF